MRLHEQEAARLRQMVISSLPQFGLSATEPNWETPLIAGGCQLGQRFEFDGLRVYWLRASNTIEFYDQDWRLLGEMKLPRPAMAA